MSVDPDGKGVAIADIEEVHEWQPDEVAAACSSGWVPGYWAWRIANVRPIVDGPVGPAQRKLYEIAPQGLAPGRYPLRPLPHRLLLRNRPRCHRHLLAVINES